MILKYFLSQFTLDADTKANVFSTGFLELILKSFGHQFTYELKHPDSPKKPFRVQIHDSQVFLFSIFFRSEKIYKNFPKNMSDAQVIFGVIILSRDYINTWRDADRI